MSIKLEDSVALQTRSYITWDAAVEVVCRLAAQHGNDGTLSEYDADRLRRAADRITGTLAPDLSHTGYSPNIWTEQHPDDKKN